MNLQARNGASGLIRDAVPNRASSTNSTVLAALVIFVVAFAIRAAWGFHVLPFIGETPFNAEMGNIGKNLAQGRGFSSPFGVGSQPTAWECPMVPFLYVGVMKVAGGPNIHASRLIVYLQSLIGSIAACVYWLIVLRLSDRNPGMFANWLPGAIAVIVCLWPDSVFTVTCFWYFVWQEAALALFLLFALAWSEKTNLLNGVLVGLSGGLVALVNVTPIPIVLIAIALLAFKCRSCADALRSAAFATLCFVAMIAPWLLRNAIAFHTLVPLRSNAGYEIFQGNNPVDCIREPENAPHPATDKQEFRRYLQMGEIRYSRYSFHRAVDYIRTYPLQTIRRIGSRIYVTWFTDLTDHWVPYPEAPWWKNSSMFKARYLVSAALIVLSVTSFFWGVFSGRFASLPAAAMFATVLIFLPLPHYFRLADTEYTATFRLSVAITSLCMLALRKQVRSDPAIGVIRTHEIPSSVSGGSSDFDESSP